MSDLIAIVYPDVSTATEVRGVLVGLQKEHLIQLGDAVVVIKEPDGKVHLDQAHSLTAAGAAGGAMWGTLIGFLFFAPLLGMAVGALSGALGGKFSDAGIEDKFMKDLGNELQPGTSALFVLVREVTPDKVLERVSQYGGKVLRSSLTNDAEARLNAALAQG